MNADFDRKGGRRAHCSRASGARSDWLKKRKNVQSVKLVLLRKQKRKAEREAAEREEKLRREAEESAKAKR